MENGRRTITVDVGRSPSALPPPTPGRSANDVGDEGNHRQKPKPPSSQRWQASEHNQRGSSKHVLWSCSAQEASLPSGSTETWLSLTHCSLGEKCGQKKNTRRRNRNSRLNLKDRVITGVNRSSCDSSYSYFGNKTRGAGKAQ